MLICILKTARVAVEQVSTLLDRAFLSPADFFSKSTFSKNSFRNTIRVTKSLDQDQARRRVGPDLSPNCLQRLSADATSWHRDCKLVHPFVEKSKQKVPDQSAH